MKIKSRRFNRFSHFSFCRHIGIEMKKKKEKNSNDTFYTCSLPWYDQSNFGMFDEWAKVDALLLLQSEIILFFSFYNFILLLMSIYIFVLLFISMTFIIVATSIFKKK